MSSKAIPNGSFTSLSHRTESESLLSVVTVMSRCGLWTWIGPTVFGWDSVRGGDASTPGRDRVAISPERRLVGSDCRARKRWPSSMSTQAACGQPWTWVQPSTRSCSLPRANTWPLRSHAACRSGTCTGEVVRERSSDVGGLDDCFLAERSFAGRGYGSSRSSNMAMPIRLPHRRCSRGSTTRLCEKSRFLRTERPWA